MEVAFRITSWARLIVKVGSPSVFQLSNWSSASFKVSNNFGAEARIYHQKIYRRTKKIK
jgi:hypothetical protein